MAKSKEKKQGQEVEMLKEFNFPEHGITLLATDIRDAEAKLQELLNNNSH